MPQAAQRRRGADHAVEEIRIGQTDGTGIDYLQSYLIQFFITHMSVGYQPEERIGGLSVQIHGDLTCRTVCCCGSEARRQPGGHATDRAGTDWPSMVNMFSMGRTKVVARDFGDRRQVAACVW